jgi:hypothetical protein
MFMNSPIDVAHELRQFALGGGEAPGVHVDRGQRQARLDVGGGLPDRVAEAAGGLVEIAEATGGEAEIVEQHRLVRILRHGLAPQALGFLHGAALRQADGEIVKDVGAVAVADPCALEQRLGAVVPARPQILQACLEIRVGLRRAVGPNGGRGGHGGLCRPASRPRLDETAW